MNTEDMRGIIYRDPEIHGGASVFVETRELLGAGVCRSCRRTSRSSRRRTSMSSIIEGDPRRGAMIGGAIKDMLASVLPHKAE